MSDVVESGAGSSVESVAAAESQEVNEQVEAQGEEVQASEEQIEAQEESQEPVSRKKKVKIKVDGKEEEVEFDPDNEEELRKHLQLSKAAMKKMSEAAKVKKQAEMFIDKLKSNPREILENPELGLDFRQLAEEYLYEQIQREQMTPEEIEYQEKMKRLEQFEAEEKSRKEQEEQQRVQAMQQKYVESYDKTITEALQQSGLPKTPATVKRMAKMLSKNLDMGLDLDPSDLVEEVKKSYYSEFKELFNAGDAQFVLNMLGDDISNKIRKHDLEKLRVPNQSTAPIQKEVNPVQKEQKKLSPDEWRAMIDKKIGN